MTDVYKQLAERLDQLPHGYPTTDTGVELEVLRKIFTPEDAEMTLKMKYYPETADAIAGNPCDHSLEVCLSFSKEEGAYDYFSRSGRIISKDEAFKVIARTEEEGLIHNVFYNTKKGHGAVCNCCSCCCGVIRAAKEYGAAHTLAKSNYIAEINSEE